MCNMECERNTLFRESWYFLHVEGNLSKTVSRLVSSQRQQRTKTQGQQRDRLFPVNHLIHSVCDSYMIPFLSLKSTFAPFNLRLHLVAIEKTFPAQRKQTYCFFSHFLFLPFSLCFLLVPFALHLPFLLFVHGHVSSTVCPHFLFNHRRLTKTNLVGLCIEMDVSTHRSAIGRGQK